jgi:multiple sugar transport system permease protein
MRKKNGLLFGGYTIAVIWALISLLPLVWIAGLSFKGPAEWTSYPPSLLPKSPTLTNFEDAFSNSPIVRYLWNSVVVTVSSLFFSLLFGSLAAYAFARLKFPLQNAAFFLIFSVRMIPALLTVIPLYVIMHQLGLLDTLWAVIFAYTATGIPMVVFIMRSFFEGLPKEIEEGAMVDGCSRLRLFFSILLPLVRPGLAASAIFVFVRTWNEFIVALSLTSSDNMRTLPVGMRNAMGERMGELGPMAAYALIAMVPIIVIFLVFQKHFVSGLVQGSNK